MPSSSTLALTVGLVLGFLALGGVFTWLRGVRLDVLALLAAGCAASVLALWLAASGPRRP